MDINENCSLNWSDLSRGFTSYEICTNAMHNIRFENLTSF